MLISATLMLALDALGRIIGSPEEIAVGIMAALMGGPFFIYLIPREKLVQL